MDACFQGFSGEVNRPWAYFNVTALDQQVYRKFSRKVYRFVHFRLRTHCFGSSARLATDGGKSAQRRREKHQKGVEGGWETGRERERGGQGAYSRLYLVSIIYI